MGLLDIIHYKLTYQLYFFLKNKNHNNIIFYGLKNSGKTTFVKHLFSTLYPSEIKKYKTGDFLVYLNNHYYYFNCSLIVNKIHFLKYFQEIIQTYDYYNHHSKYIILDNFEDISSYLQNSLKVILEKSCYTCKIIIITNKFNKVILPIQSRCITMKIPKKNHNDTYLYLKNEFKDTNEFLLLEDCKKYDIETIINMYTVKNYKDINVNVYQKFKECIYSRTINIEALKKIKEISSIIKELNIPLNILIGKFFMESKEIDYGKIQKCSENEYFLQNSFRELIHIEHLILNLNTMINNNK